MPESWTITAREAAGLVGVSRQTFRRWVAQGKMPPPVINRRYSREQVRAEARGEWEPGAAQMTDRHWKERMMARLETGVVQPEDDWPGVFIRGDNALAMAHSLAAVIEAAHTDTITKGCARRLLKLLRSCDATRDDAEIGPAVQFVRVFDPAQ